MALFNQMIKKPKLYIIPGYQETTRRHSYQKLSKKALSLGYDVVKVNPIWSMPLSSQLFSIEDGSSVVAFSLGAVIAELSIKKFKPKSLNKIIFASPTTYLCADDLNGILPNKIISDVKSIGKNGFKTATYFYGELEKDLLPKYVPKKIKIKKLIPQTGHILSAQYIQEIVDRLK